MNAKQFLYYLCIYMIFRSSLSFIPPAFPLLHLLALLPFLSALLLCQSAVSLRTPGIILIPSPLPPSSSLEPHPSDSSVLQGVQSGVGGWQEGRGVGWDVFFLVLLQNDDETIWRLVVAGVCREGNREMGWGGGGTGGGATRQCK